MFTSFIRKRLINQVKNGLNRNIMICSAKSFNRTTINSNKLLLNNKTPCRNYTTNKNVFDIHFYFISISTVGECVSGIAYSGFINAEESEIAKKIITSIGFGMFGTICGFLGSMFIRPILIISAIGVPSFYIGQKI